MNHQDKPFKIIFMGTPEFAVPSLEALLLRNEDVVAVVTQPDRPKGRGRKLTPPPVKELALPKNLPVLQPDNAALQRVDAFHFIQHTKLGQKLQHLGKVALLCCTMATCDGFQVLI